MELINYTLQKGEETDFSNQFHLFIFRHISFWSLCNRFFPQFHKTTVEHKNKHKYKQMKYRIVRRRVLNLIFAIYIQNLIIYLVDYQICVSARGTVSVVWRGQHGNWYKKNQKEKRKVMKWGWHTIVLVDWVRRKEG